MNLDILHIHAEFNLPFPSEVSIVRTVHVHTPYCPSGSRYLNRWEKRCDRAYSLGGCLWGHLFDHCGSVRPQKLLAEFQRVRLEMESLPQILTIANSEFVRDQMLRSGYPADKVQTLLCPAPAAKAYVLPPAEGTPHFLFLGRIAPEKGWGWLLKSLSCVKIPVHLDIAGSGNEQQNRAIQVLAERLGLMDRVTFHGWINPQQAMRLLQQTRALIFPSIWHEPAGLVTLEAAAMGRAVIASQVGGIPEYGNRLGNVILVEASDQQGLTERIEHLAQDWQLASNLGYRGYQNAQQHFSIVQHEQQLMQLYQRAIAEWQSDKKG
ncbi:MAG: glycosyltransferase family 4 protein [Aphanocapsa sp. GSE-SYN-MK-11-07L]|nr:glycosyltransferase family 4 protein [Aphanocapsa sp. GSE-SYN-MK-11-07L]